MIDIPPYTAILNHVHSSNVKHLLLNGFAHNVVFSSHVSFNEIGINEFMLYDHFNVRPGEEVRDIKFINTELQTLSKVKVITSDFDYSISDLIGIPVNGVTSLMIGQNYICLDMVNDEAGVVGPNTIVFS